MFKKLKKTNKKYKKKQNNIVETTALARPKKRGRPPKTEEEKQRPKNIDLITLDGIKKQREGGDGRPLIVVDAQVKKQIEKLSSVLKIEQIADYFGITRETFHQLMKRDKEILACYKRGKSRANAMVGSHLLDKIRAGNMAATIFYLKTQAGWKSKQEIIIENRESTINIEDLTLEQASALYKKQILEDE